MNKETFKVHDPTGIDALNLMGILAGGGLAGQAQHALSQMDKSGQDEITGAGLQALSALFMGALANVELRDQIRAFLCDMWKTTEDEQASEADLNIQDRLEPRYENGELKKDTLFYRKLKRFYKLTPRQMMGIAVALYKHPEFKDFLGFLREELATITTEQPTASNGSTGSPISKLPVLP